MGNMTITEFLLARIAEAEAVASDPYLDAPDLGPTFGIGYDTGGADGRSARFLTIDPARVLAECRAKRAIIELREAIDREIRAVALADHERATDMRATRLGLDMAIKAHAEVYAEHTDFDEAWRG